MMNMKALILLLTVTIISGCSEQREQLKTEIEEFFMTEEEKRMKYEKALADYIKQERLSIVNNIARSEIQKGIIEQYEHENKTYSNISIHNINIIDRAYSLDYKKLEATENGLLLAILSGMTKEVPYNNRCYKASYSATIESDNFVTISATDVEGELMVCFNEDEGKEFEYGTILDKWRVTGQDIHSTGRGEKALEIISEIFK